MSNRFPADDEHLHPYPGNLKHHKVSPAMERTIPEVYRAALATLESLIEDGYDHAKERQRKLLCEMMKDDAKSGLYNEKKRHPLLRDSDLAVGIALEDYLMSPEHRQLMANHLEAQKGFFDKAVKAATASYELQNGWLREALLKLVELEDRTLEGMSSCAPSSEEWLKAFNEARYVIDITRP